MKTKIRVWTLDELILANKVKLGRGNIISKKDIANFPGEYPIYSSAREKNGTFGYYGKYMFDEELITWSIDGGGRLFYRPRHKFSVTNVGGTLRVLDTDFLNCRYLHLVLTHLHSKIRFDWVYKAHPSVIRMVYNEIPIPSLEKQREIVEKLDSIFAEIKNLETKSNSQIRVMKELAFQLIRKFLEDPLNESKQCYLDEISENLDSRRIPITRDVRTAGSFPYYGASGVIDYVDDFIFEGDALLVSEDGANLLARSTPIAFPVTGKYWVNNHAHILKFQDSNLQRFVEHFLESIKLDQYITGAAQPKLTQTALNAIPIPVPLKSEDLRQIVLKIEIVKEMVSKYLTNLTRMNLLLEEVKMSLLDQLYDLEIS